jgi:glycosyltransferase involved in cell wall biosynthesis
VLGFICVIAPRVGIVVIGRNEGNRLIRCLGSLPKSVQAVYVDSGSTDGSLEKARELGFEAFALSPDKPYSAARARNAGAAFFRTNTVKLDYLQMLDGDCELDTAWITKAVSALSLEPTLAVVFGRRKERSPDASVYNAICDDEWNVPIGLVDTCGGDALFCVSAFEEVGGYNERLIAGEEPDLCLRLKGINRTVRRIDADMTVHDAAISTFKQWSLRARRSGFAYAEHVFVHGHQSLASWKRSLLSIIVWAVIVPVLCVTMLVSGLYNALPIAVGVAFILASLYPLQWVRIASRKRHQGASKSFSRVYASLMLTGKFPQFGGVVRATLRHITKSRRNLIEYKVPQ